MPKRSDYRTIGAGQTRNRSSGPLTRVAGPAVCISLILVVVGVIAERKMGAFFGKPSTWTPTPVLEYTASSPFKYEVRSYPPQVEAYVSSGSFAAVDPERASSIMFMKLAKYIGVFGTPQNRARGNSNPEAMAMTAPVLNEPEPIAMTAPVMNQPEAIAMTAPVMNQPEQTDGAVRSQTMAFLLPLPTYDSVESAPVPTDEDVKLRLIPGRTLAVVTFAGNRGTPADDAFCKEQFNKLVAALQDDKRVTLPSNPQWIMARYNPPYTPPMFRTNEVMVPVELS
eukprot:CAMPEP_0198309948 /NCGR_PEP_ID=MMETSP1450-20131203/2168_1 /TAXON_ID=753684 ORGANISM="Madagascaria erythrocladiodes, Strain CCMP3234" /NCGR_SAMPLE_ID=MMETSP1450 /ASSEMBLY_ACC=CAM_ASM_001115 /LENGTH=281 /DNA_ID=CAMNT_0044012733 /DNA_START=20 /DNA_END=865 /DNA_ORIENTATION=+